MTFEAGFVHEIDHTLGLPGPALRVRQLLFSVLVLFCLLIPTSWTQDVLKENRENQRQRQNQGQATNGTGVVQSTEEVR